MTIHEFFSFLSLSLTPMTMASAAAVIYAYGGVAKRGILYLVKKGTDHKMAEREWFILGIVVGFTGGYIDNFYWGFAWTADWLDLEMKGALFNSGVYSNLPFRQLAGIIAALCHIAFIYWMPIGDNKSKKIKTILFFGLNLSLVFSIFLLIMKP